MTSLETLGAFIADGVRGAVTGGLHDAAVLHAIDTVGAWVAGSGVGEAKALRVFRDEQRRAGGAAPAREVMINCALVRLTEVDDIHLAAMITPGAIVIPATLSVAASMPGVTPAVLTEAIVCGYEAMVRLGIAINGPAALYRGIWPSYFATGFGAAAATARLADLNAGQTAHALALALTLAPPGVGLHHATTSSRWLAIGACARNGYLAALAAKSGFTSDTGILDGKFFSGVYDIVPDPSALTSGLGTRFAVNEVSFKPWCAARQTMAATQAFTEMMARGIDIASIGSIDISIPPPFLRMVDHGIVEGDRLSRLTSVPYQIAVAALDPDTAYDSAQTGDVPAAVRELMAKVTVAADERLMGDYPAVWPARVAVNVSGTVHEHVVTQVPGDPGRPFGLREIRGKMHRFSDRRIGAQAVEGLIAETQMVFAGKKSPRQLLDSIEHVSGSAT